MIREPHRQLLAPSSRDVLGRAVATLLPESPAPMRTDHAGHPMATETSAAPPSPAPEAKPAQWVTPSMRRGLRLWRRVSLILAVIGLASLFDRIVKWAQWIHWVVVHYQGARDWAFGWLPWRVPEDWRDVAALSVIMLASTATGFQFATGRSFLPVIAPLALVGALGAVFAAMGVPYRPAFSPDMMPVACLVGLAFAVLFVGEGYLAWRWLLATAAAFAALFAVNEVYVRLLVPMGY